MQDEVTKEIFRYLGTTLTNQKYIQEATNSRLKSWNACYHSVQNVLSSGLLWSIYGGRGEVHTGFWWRNLEERNNLKDSDVDGRIILKWFFRKWDGSMGWSDLAQSRDKWRAVVSAVMNFFGFHKFREISWLAGNLSTSKEVLCCMQYQRYYVISAIDSVVK